MRTGGITGFLRIWTQRRTEMRGRNEREVRFEGLTEAEVLALPQEEVNGLILLGEPLVFRVGSATLLGSFRVTDKRLIIELAQIDGGGEGVLVALSTLARRYAFGNGLSSIEWIVHAVTCAKPNPKLRRVLEQRRFVIDDISGIGPAYHLIDDLMDK
jgi:hypothetical protein